MESTVYLISEQCVMYILMCVNEVHVRYDLKIDLIGTRIFYC